MTESMCIEKRERDLLKEREREEEKSVELSAVALGLTGGSGLDN